MRKKIFHKCTLLNNVNSIMASSKMIGVASMVMEEWQRPGSGN
jgi:hypothetical protein